MEDSGAGASRGGVSQPCRAGTTWLHLAMASNLSSRLKHAMVEECLLRHGRAGRGLRGQMAWRWRRRDWCRRRRRGPGCSGSGGTKAIDFPLTEGEVPWPLGRSCSARTACCRGALLHPRGRSRLGTICRWRHCGPAAWELPAGRVGITFVWDTLVQNLIIDMTFVFLVMGLLPPLPLPPSLSASASASSSTSSSSPPVTMITFCGHRVNYRHRH